MALRYLMYFFLGSCVASLHAADRVDTAPADGLHGGAAPVASALIGARVHVQPGQVLEQATVLIRDGRIEAVGRDLRIPDDAVRLDLKGLDLYAGFIDLNSDLGIAATATQAPPGPNPLRQQADQPGTPHYNRRVLPEQSAATRFQPDAARARTLHQLGFTHVLSAPSQGIFRGQGALLALQPDKDAGQWLVQADLSQHLAFEMGSWPGDAYPGSLMGAIALIRQVLHDARWYGAQSEHASRTGQAPAAANAALAALQPVLAKRQSLFFRLDDELDLARVDALAREFDLDVVGLGSGYEYRQLQGAVSAGRDLVLPLTFPALPKLEDPLVAMDVDTSQLSHIEQAPANPARLVQAGLRVAFTAAGLDKPAEQFWPRLREAVRAGLSPQQALAALTTAPASMLKQQNMGRIAAGQVANLVIADAQLFERADAQIREVWVAGVRHPRLPLESAQLAGRWQLAFADGPNLEVELEQKSPGQLSGRVDGKEWRLVEREGRWLWLLPGDALEQPGRTLIVSGALRDGRFDGDWLADDGRARRLSAELLEARAAESKPAPERQPIPAFDRYPAGAYGVAMQRQRVRDVLIRGATVWTQAESGLLERSDVLVRDGRIAAIGDNLSAPARVPVIDAAGRHLSPGLIDAHSHTAIARGVNEPSHAVTSEVRIADVLDPTDINIYRQLAGGLTSALLLHGSANPIGGQSETIKMRWGSDAAGLRFRDAMPGIKFALGENVKQSNRGEAFVVRYPQSRMGVEQIIDDAFLAARAQAAATEAGKRRGAAPVRRNLRLEALQEVLENRRRVHIHSYRQDEILMFVRTGERFGLKDVVFQHILEGYKAADAIAAAGYSASGFSDWWAYKMEVYDAIPYNATLMSEVGVLSSFNSDSDEMARRLNTEAAKAVKYGGMSEQQALALVTINPARQLGIDRQVGSIEVGKDADLVLWSDHPLSSYARADHTWVDGELLYDRQQDAERVVQDRIERERLLARVLDQRLGEQSLKLAVDPPKTDQPEAEDASESTPPSTPPDRRSARASLWAIALDPHPDVHFASLRGLYHDGRAINTCNAQEHAHR